MKKKALAGDAMMLAATMIFGAMTIFSKQILAELEVFNMVALRFLIAFAVCFAVFHKRYKTVDKETTLHAFVLGTFLFISYFCMVEGCKYTTASNAGFMMSLVAFFTPLIVWAQEKKRPTGRQTASILITLFGVGLMCLSGRLTLNKGDLICICCAFFYAFQMLYTERYAHKHDPIVLGTFQLIFVSVYAFIFSFALEDSFRLPQSGAGWGQLLYLALGCGALGFILQTAAEKYSSANHATIIYASQPVFVAIFSYLMLAEPISLRQIAGIIIVFIGVLITVRTDGGSGNKGFKHISQDKAMQIMEEETGYLIVDVRRPDEFAAGHIEGAINVPNEGIADEMLEELPDKDQMLLIYCRTGRRAKDASRKLAKIGYTNVHEFGGIGTWTGTVVTENN